MQCFYFLTSWFVIWDVASQFLYQIIQVWQLKLLTGAVVVWCTSSNTKEWLWWWGHLSWWNEPADWTKQSRMSVIHEVIGHWLDCLCVILINYPYLKFDRSHQQSRKYSLSIDHDNCPKWVHTNNYLCPVVMRRLLSNVHHSIRERDTSPQPQPTPPATPTRSRSHKR